MELDRLTLRSGTPCKHHVADDHAVRTKDKCMRIHNNWICHVKA